MKSAFRSRWDYSGYRSGWVFLLLVMLAPRLLAQAPVGAGVIKDFKYPEYDKQNRIKSLLSGKTAHQHPNDRVTIDGLRVETFNAEGKVELTVEAPQCELDTKKRVAWSDAKMEARTGDGRFFIEGVGFEWRQADTHLFISNQVHTIVHQELFKTVSTGAPAQPVTTNTTPREPLEIFSDQLDTSLTNRVALYTGHVKVNDPRTQINSEKLTIRGLSATNSQIDTIVAEQDVVIVNKQDQSRATGGKAVYTSTNNVVVLTENPALENAQGKLFGEKVILYREKNELEALNGVRMNVNPGRTNNPTMPRQPLQLFADKMHANLTNRVAVYTGNVHAEDPKMEMTCEILNVLGAEKGGGVERIIAKNNVVIINKEDKSRATGDLGIYTATDNVMNLTGSPVLESERGKLIANALMLHRTESLLYADGNVKTEIHQAPRPGHAAQPPLYLFSDTAIMNLTNKAGLYTGHVRADDPKMEITCEKLTVVGATNSNQTGATNCIESIIAEHDVVIVNKQDHSRATGDKAVYTGDNDTVRLTGKPMLQNDTGKLYGELILLNRVENTLDATGGVRMEVESRNAGKFAPGVKPRTNAAPAAVSVAKTTNQAPSDPLLIFADNMHAVLTNRLAIYTGHVHAEHPKMNLTCETMTVKGATNSVSSTSTNSIESIVAERNVVIKLALVKKDGTKDEVYGMGDKAVYTGETDSVELSGHSTLRHGNSVMIAEPFILDLKKNTIRAIHGYESSVAATEFKKTNASPKTPALEK